MWNELRRKLKRVTDGRLGCKLWQNLYISFGIDENKMYHIILKYISALCSAWCVMPVECDHQQDSVCQKIRIYLIKYNITFPFSIISQHCDNPRNWHLSTWRRVHSQYHGPLARYVKLWVAHAPRMPGAFSPSPRVSDCGMHHSTCVMHVPRCMPGSLTSVFLWSRWRGKRYRHSRRKRNPTFTYLARSQWRLTTRRRKERWHQQTSSW